MLAHTDARRAGSALDGADGRTGRRADPFVAAGLVLAAFCVREMPPLRIIAIGGNLAFITYGYLAGLRPVLLLHLVLLPTNRVRLSQLVRERRRARPLPPAPAELDAPA